MDFVNGTDVNLGVQRVDWVEYCSSKIHVHLENQNVTLLKNRVFADIIT